MARSAYDTPDSWEKELLATRLSMLGDEQAPLAESFELGPGVTRGIKDLTVTMNVSADASQRVSYKFDGHIYRRSGSAEGR